MNNQKINILKYFDIINKQAVAINRCFFFKTINSLTLRISPINKRGLYQDFTISSFEKTKHKPLNSKEKLVLFNGKLVLLNRKLYICQRRLEKTTYKFPCDRLNLFVSMKTNDSFSIYIADVDCR